MSVDTTARFTSGMALVLMAAISLLVVNEHAAGADPSGFGAAVVVLAAFGTAVAVSGVGQILADLEGWPVSDGRAGTVQSIATVILLAAFPAAMAADPIVLSEFGLLGAGSVIAAVGWLATNRYIYHQFNIAERLGAAFNQGDSA